MKKWNEYSGSEKRMVVVIVILFLLVLLTFSRVDQGARRGFQHFFLRTDTVQNK